MNNSQTEYIIQCQNLSKTFNDVSTTVEVLKSVNFDIKSGERVAIVGASGSGKSTLLHLLGGLDELTEGNIIVAGQNISNLSESKKSKFRNKTLGFVYQFHHLLPEFTAMENVAMPLLIRGLKTQDAKEQALTMLGKVGLDHRVNHKPGELSGGERQRAAIARALVTNPQCVLADEPTGNLDTKTANTVYEMMLELNQSLNTSFLVVTHDETLAAKMDRVMRLDEGCLREY
ncbi:MAG: lipoprotein-releasing ABC transporter ATP-binding protein LolD [Gammaproteobacteria bacterium]|nr:lipoprotein-releasing ABC transporter ATP-binding protein LolD [Gammaproteobacteria bacterium]